MGLGLKRIFKRKKSKSKSKENPRTPSRTKDVPPPTPPTKSLSADEEEELGAVGRRDDVSSQYSKELPVKNLLEELNIHTPSQDHGDTELVLGTIPVEEGPYDEPAALPESNDSPEADLSPSSDADHDEPGITESPKDEKSTDDIPVESTEMPVLSTPHRSYDESISLNELPDPENSPLKPRKLDDPASSQQVEDVQIVDRETSDVTKEIMQSPPSSTTPSTSASGTTSTRFSMDQPKSVARTLFQLLETATQCSTGIYPKEPPEKLYPTADNALCQPSIGESRTRSDLSRKSRNLEREYSFYDEQFALKFLDELLNVGYALVHHEQLIADDNDDDDNDEDEGDWVGRSVTLIMRPGICNAIQVNAPCLEWSTLGGGLQTSIETKAVSLLDIYSIKPSNIEDALEEEVEEDNNGDAQEELQSFFTLTTKQGKVYVMEAITADEAQRIVAGVKNLTSRISKQIIAGDATVLSDFFDNSQEPHEIRLSLEEAMVRLSNSLMEDLSST